MNSSLGTFKYFCDFVFLFPSFIRVARFFFVFFRLAFVSHVNCIPVPCSSCFVSDNEILMQIEILN